MLIGVVSDIHSDVTGLRHALDRLAEAGVDEVISLGDALEARRADAVAPEFDEIALWRPELADLLARATLVRGNQEERITAAGARDVPAAARRLLDAPLEVERDGVLFRHGHDLEGEEVEHDRWVPLHHGLGAAVIVHGHHHRTSIVELGGPQDGWAGCTDIAVESGAAVQLKPGRRYLVNVGPAWGANPATAVVDTSSRTVEIVFSERRPGPRSRWRSPSAVAVLTSDRLGAVAHARALASDVLVVAAAKYAARNAGWLAVPDLSDSEAVTDAISHGVPEGGVRAITAATEKAVLPAAIAREALGIPGTPASVALGFTDKAEMKRRFQNAGVPVADWGRASTLDEVLDLTRRFDGAVVVKPVVGSGGRDISAFGDVTSIEAASAALNAILARTDVIVERRLDLRAEYHCDAVVRGGEVVFATQSVDHAPLLGARAVSPTTVGSMLLAPDSPIAALIRDLHDRALAGVGGLEDGVTHFECFTTPDGLFAGEIAHRPGGGGVVDVVHAATGVDIVEQQVRAELGLDHGLDESRERALGAFGWCYLDTDTVDPEFVAGMDGVMSVRAGDGGGSTGVVLLHAVDHGALVAAHARMIDAIGVAS